MSLRTLSFFQMLLWHVSRDNKASGCTGHQMRNDNCHGFTLVELMVVLAILGILAGTGASSYQSYMRKIRIMDVIADIRSIEQAIAVYKSVNGSLPPDLKTVRMDDMKDRWGNSYYYVRVEGAKPGNLRKDRSLHPVNSDYDLYSAGEDGKTATPFTAQISQDDIVRANDGAYIGLVSEY